MPKTPAEYDEWWDSLSSPMLDEDGEPVLGDDGEPVKVSPSVDAAMLYMALRQAEALERIADRLDDMVLAGLPVQVQGSS